MRKKTLFSATLLTCLALAFAAGNVWAALFSGSTSIIDWNSLNISTSGMTIEYYWYGDRSEAHAWNANSADYDYDEIRYWGNTTATAYLTNATGSAWTTESTIGESVAADADAGSYAYAGRAAGFHVSGGSGTITISVDYQLGQEMQTNVLGDYAAGDAWTWLGLYNIDYDNNDYYLVALNNEIADGDSFSDSATGTLSVSLFFNEGDDGWFDVGAENYANTSSVPLPGSIVLMASGLFGLAGFRKRKSRQ